MKWTNKALAAYKAAGEELRTLGYHPLREIQDKDCGTVLTFWTTGNDTVIQQTWNSDNGDVVIWEQRKR